MSKLLDYWAERAREAINVELMEDAQAAAEIQRIATMMCADIMKEILAYYAKLATAEGIDWKEAKKIADTFDVEAFQAKAKQLVESKDFSKEANKSLKRYNTAMYVSREKLLKQQLHMIVVDSYSKQENVVKRHLEDSIERTMKHQSGILGADVKIKKTDIQAIVNADFKNVTWSKRLWTDQTQLQTEVEKMASNVMTRGRHPKEFVKNIRSIAEPKLNQIKGKVTHNAKRLLITEAARVQSEAQRLHYIEILGEDGEYTFIAKMDEKTSAICKAHDSKVYKVKEMVPGVNAPPLHPHCRSTTAPRPDKDWRKNFFARKKKENSSDKANENIRNVDNVTEQENARKEMKALIGSGKIKVELNPEKQNRHQLGHDLYVKYKKKNKKLGLPIPSYTTVSNEYLNEFINRNDLSTKLATDSSGKWTKKEVVEFDRVIGKVNINGEFIKTRYGTIHYSKTGTHVVPRKSDD